METTPATLYFMCGKMGAGKSTLAKSLAPQNGAVLLSEDDLLRHLYPSEITDLKSYVSYSGRLKSALSEHIRGVLQRGLSVVLDFPANTMGQRAWLRELIETSGAKHQLHFVDTPDETCKKQLRARNSNGGGDPLQDEASFDLLSSYFVAPTSDEGFTIVRHERT
jgi:predicted kinase